MGVTVGVAVRVGVAVGNGVGDWIAGGPGGVDGAGEISATAAGGVPPRFSI